MGRIDIDRQEAISDRLVALRGDPVIHDVARRAGAAHVISGDDHMTLAANGIAPTLIGGPREGADLAMLSRPPRRVPRRVARGGEDIAGLLDALEPVDLIVASDGGTAHLCALRKPVCSLFGSSPWRRYAMRRSADTTW